MAKAASWKQSLHQVRRLLAKIWLHLNPQVTIIGITGSYGKTNTTRAIAQVLSEKYEDSTSQSGEKSRCNKTLQTDLNLDTIYNLPITILKLRPWHRFLVLEYGVDHVREMDFHLGLVKPKIGVLTGITPVHSDPELLGSLEGVIKEKGKLLEALPKKGLAILNGDDKHVWGMAKKTQAKVFWYGTDRSQSDWWAEKIKVDFSGTSFWLGQGQKRKVRVKTGLVGQHFVHACLAAAIIGQQAGLTWKQIQKGLARLKPLRGRLSIEEGPKGSILLNDALRANPASTVVGLQTLADLPTKGKRIAVLGEMGELGTSAKKSHQEIGQKAAELKIDRLVSVGPLQKLTAKEAIKSGMKKENVFWVQNVHQAAEVLKKILKKGDLVYLKGSLLRHLERVILLLKGGKVGCQVVSCEVYNQCLDCKYLKTGLNS